MTGGKNNTVSRVLVVIAGVLILMCLGVAYSWGVFLLPIEQEMGWSRVQISFAVSVLLLVFSLFMAVGGILEKKLGPANTAAIGGALIGLGWIGASFSISPYHLYLFYGLLAGIGTGLCYMPAISSGIRSFPEKKGLITGIIVFGFGFGAAFLSPVITHVIDAYGWRTAMLSLGSSFAAVIILASRFLIVPVNGPEGGSALKIDPSFSPLQMIKTSQFRAMFLTYLIAMLAGMMIIGHIIAFVTGKGFSPMQGAFALTALAVFNGLGRILFGHASDIWGCRRILIMLFMLIASAMFALYHSGSLPGIYSLSMLVGLCFGGFLAVYPALTADYFGCRDFSINYGLVFIGYGSGCFAGPLIGGWVHDISGNYMAAFYFAGALALLGSAQAYLFLKSPCEK
jgi:MFS transporter, OFA family, oxalate/formate antiporter